MELVFNDLSSNSLISPAEARSQLRVLVLVSLYARRRLRATPMRVGKDFYVLTVGDHYTVADYLNDPQVTREEKSGLLTVAAKAPYIDEDLTAAAALSECTIGDM